LPPGKKKKKLEIFPFSHFSRNVLIEEENNSIIAKITDFGLARITDESNGYYRVPEWTGRHLPIRIMAPETFVTKKFTKESDVWAFGCICKSV
jgi:serine/threonine protein kinase